MTDNIDYRKGRNLAVISFLIIVYVWAGAEVTEQGIAGGFLLKIERPHIIEAAAAVLLAFSGYQFAIHLSQPSHRTQQRLYDHLSTDGKLRQHVDARAQQLVDGVSTKGGMQDMLGASQLPNLQSTIKARWQPKKANPGARSQVHPVPERHWSCVRTTAKVQQGEGNQVLGNVEVEIDPWFYYWRQFVALVRAVYRHEDAWHDVFPILLYCGAWIAIVYNTAAS